MDQNFYWMEIYTMKILSVLRAVEKDRAERKAVSGKKPNIKKYLDETITQLEKIKKELGE